jgi:DNA-binding transcriptional LysR family regulator
VSETIQLDDLRLFAMLAELGSFTAAARALAIPKQTLSRRIALLETRLGAQLVHRTTRTLRLSQIGAAYAERCAAIVRAASEANDAVRDADRVPRGVLRISTDPLFGDAFVGDLVIEQALRWPELGIEVSSTRRRVDLIDEGFDVAFRVGRVDDPRLTATALGPARVRYCAAPEYVRRRGRPRSGAELAAHECILVAGPDEAVSWPVNVDERVEVVVVRGRLRVDSFAIAHRAALRGLGIAIFPEFACAADVAAGRLVPVLGDRPVDVGAVWLVHPRARYLTPRVRTFVDLAIEQWAAQPPWTVPAATRRMGRRGG